MTPKAGKNPSGKLVALHRVQDMDETLVIASGKRPGVLGAIARGQPAGTLFKKA